MRIAIVRFTKILMTCLCLFYSFTVRAIPVKEEINKPVILKDDPLPVQKVIIIFLQWYKVNLHKANSFPLLAKDSADNYVINKNAVTNYLNFLKSSKCISPKYIAYWQTYFDDKATELKEHPVQSDIPEGFDFDFVLITQEPDLVLNQINRTKFKTVSMNSTVALIGLKWPGKDSMQYEFEMYKGKDGWQIGYISTPNYD